MMKSQSELAIFIGNVEGYFVLALFCDLFLFWFYKDNQILVLHHLGPYLCSRGQPLLEKTTAEHSQLRYSFRAGRCCELVK